MSTAGSLENRRNNFRLDLLVASAIEQRTPAAAFVDTRGRFLLLRPTITISVGSRHPSASRRTTRSTPITQRPAVTARERSKIRRFRIATRAFLQSRAERLKRYRVPHRRRPELRAGAVFKISIHASPAVQKNRRRGVQYAISDPPHHNPVDAALGAYGSTRRESGDKAPPQAPPTDSANEDHEEQKRRGESRPRANI